LGISRLKYQAGSGVLRYAVALPPPYAGFESECCLRIKANSTIENKGLWGHKPWRNFIPWFVSSQTIASPWFVSSQTNTVVSTILHKIVINSNNYFKVVIRFIIFNK
jgi:hypothetical protein